MSANHVSHYKVAVRWYVLVTTVYFDYVPARNSEDSFQVGVGSSGCDWVNVLTCWHKRTCWKILKFRLSWVFLSIWMKKRRLPFKLGPGYISATGVDGHQRRDRHASGRSTWNIFIPWIKCVSIYIRRRYWIAIWIRRDARHRRRWAWVIWSAGERTFGLTTNSVFWIFDNRSKSELHIPAILLPDHIVCCKDLCMRS